MHKTIFAIFLVFLITPTSTESYESLNIGTYTVDINSSITIPIEISNASDIAGGSVNLTYNSSLATIRPTLRYIKWRFLKSYL